MLDNVEIHDSAVPNTPPIASFRIILAHQPKCPSIQHYGGSPKGSQGLNILSKRRGLSRHARTFCWDKHLISIIVCGQCWQRSALLIKMGERRFVSELGRLPSVPVCQCASSRGGIIALATAPSDCKTLQHWVKYNMISALSTPADGSKGETSPGHSH